MRATDVNSGDALLKYAEFCVSDLHGTEEQKLTAQLKIVELANAVADIPFHYVEQRLKESRPERKKKWWQF